MAIVILTGLSKKIKKSSVFPISTFPQNLSSTCNAPNNFQKKTIKVELKAQKIDALHIM